MVAFYTICIVKAQVAAGFCIFYQYGIQVIGEQVCKGRGHAVFINQHVHGLANSAGSFDLGVDIISCDRAG